jgi:hypothetical protein
MKIRDVVLGKVVTTPRTERTKADDRKVWWRRPGLFLNIPGYQGNPTLMKVLFFFSVPPGIKLAFYYHKSTDPLHCHNHGGRVVSLILRGGYLEERITGLGTSAYRDWVHQKPGKINYMGTDVFHRVAVLPKGKALTLVLVLPNVQEIGYWVGGKFVPRWRYFKDGHSAGRA